MDHADYAAVIQEAATTGKPFTARNVPEYDQVRLTRQIRYQARKLGIEVHISVNPQEGTVTITCGNNEPRRTRKPDPRRRAR